MIVNNITTNRIFRQRQKKTLMKAWDRFKDVMTSDEKREYQSRLFTIKHIEAGFCSLKDKVYFGQRILIKNVKKMLL